MGAIENIYKMLAKLKIYDLKAKYIGAELSAYEVGFQHIEDKIYDVLKNTFVFLAQDKELKKYERMLLLPTAKNSSIDNRRDMICSRMAITKNDYTKMGITKAIRSIGFDAEIEEIPQSGKIKICNHGFLKEYDSLDEIKSAMLKILPAHLDFELDIGVLTWDMFEKKNLTFSGFDANEFPWVQLDLNGHNLKGGI